MTISKCNCLVRGGFALALLGATSAASAVTLGTFDNTTVTYGGYLKLDMLLSDYSDGSMATGIGRDFYVPSLTPVGGTSEDMKLDFHARQSRFNFGTSTELDGHTLKTFFELDFMATAGGDERVSNSYSPRMRQAYLSYDKWLFGQTWTTFQNTASLPDTVDFIGNTDAGIFVRQAQIRYSSGPWQFAIENPESTLTPNGGGARIVSDDNGLPDFVGRYNLTSGGLSMSFAVLLRQLAYDNGVNDSTESSAGVSITGKYNIGKDDIRFGLNTGSGMGRYIGLNTVNGGVLTASGEIEAIDSTGIFVAYRHVIGTTGRMNFVYSMFEADNDITLTGAATTKSTDSVRVNYIMSPVKNLDLGFELSLANRDLESGSDGSMTRFQFGAKLAF